MKDRNLDQCITKATYYLLLRNDKNLIIFYKVLFYCNHFNTIAPFINQPYENSYLEILKRGQSFHWIHVTVIQWRGKSNAHPNYLLKYEIILFLMTMHIFDDEIV